MNKLIYTDGYIDNPIKYESDARFEPKSIIKINNEMSLAGRDVSSFISVNGTDTKIQNVAIQMTSPRWDSQKFVSVIGIPRTQFTYFV